jgi:hypothetical protein
MSIVAMLASVCGGTGKFGVYIIGCGWGNGRSNLTANKPVVLRMLDIQGSTRHEEIACVSEPVRKGE